MSYWVYLEDRTVEPECSFGKEPADDYERQYGACTKPCYPSVIVEQHAEGGTYALGGTSAAELNATYNYAKLFRAAWEAAGGTFDGSGDGSLGEMLGAKRAGDVVATLERAVDHLGTDRADNYWDPTPGNAGYALSILLAWARQHPDAIFRVS